MPKLSASPQLHRSAEMRSTSPPLPDVKLWVSIGQTINCAEALYSRTNGYRLRRPLKRIIATLQLLYDLAHNYDI